MSPFRDEKAALDERVARLEEDLRDAREVQAAHASVAEERRDPEAAATPAPHSRVAFAIVGALVVGVGLLAFVAQHGEAPKARKPTDPTSVAEARDEASRAGLGPSAQLFGIKALYVSSDGTLHASPAYAPRVEFVFADPPKPKPVSSVPRPLGAPEDPMTSFQNEYTVSLYPSDSRVEQSFVIPMHAAVPEPHCRLADVWKAAQAAGAPAEAVAIIEYAEGMVPARARKGSLSHAVHWHFEITMTPPFEVDVSDRDCTVIR